MLLRSMNFAISRFGNKHQVTKMLQQAFDDNPPEDNAIVERYERKVVRKLAANLEIPYVFPGISLASFPMVYNIATEAPIEISSIVCGCYGLINYAMFDNFRTSMYLDQVMDHLDDPYDRSVAQPSSRIDHSRCHPGAM